MDWRREAAEDLRGHAARRRALVGIEERIALLEAEMQAGQRQLLDPVGGGRRGGGSFDRMADMVAQKEKLEMSRELTRRRVELVELGLGGLEAGQRRILERFFCEGEELRRAERLGMELNMDRASVYRLRDEALRQFTIGMFGLCEV